MHIPVGEMVQVKKSGTITKAVTCEHCGTEYVYNISRTGQASGFSPLFLASDWAKRDAQNGAEQDLAQRLATAEEMVPCPSCGHYQEAMIRAQRKKQTFWVGCGYIAVSIILFILWIFLQTQRQRGTPLIDWPLWTIAALIPAALAVVAWIWLFWDKKSLSADEIARTRTMRRGVTKSEYEAVGEAALQMPAVQEEWITVRQTDLKFPNNCIQCLRPTLADELLTFDYFRHLKIPMCKTCRIPLKRKSLFIQFLILLLGALLTWPLVTFILEGTPIGETLIYSTLTWLPIGTVLCVLYSNAFVLPIKLRNWDAQRHEVQLRFGNHQYKELMFTHIVAQHDSEMTDQTSIAGETEGRQPVPSQAPETL